MNTENKIKDTLIKNTNAFILNEHELLECINGQADRTQILKEKLTPIVKEIIRTVKEGDDI